MAEGAVVAEGEGMAEDGVDVLSPRVVAPRAPSVFALDRRALALFRIAFMAFWLLEFFMDRLWAVISTDGLYGIRSEKLAPAAWVRKNFPHHDSVFLDYPQPVAQAAPQGASRGLINSRTRLKTRQ